MAPPAAPLSFLSLTFSLWPPFSLQFFLLLRLLPAARVRPLCKHSISFFSAFGLSASSLLSCCARPLALTPPQHPPIRAIQKRGGFALTSVFTNAHAHAQQRRGAGVGMPEIKEEEETERGRCAVVFFFSLLLGLDSRPKRSHLLLRLAHAPRHARLEPGGVLAPLLGGVHVGRGHVVGGG